jgi:peptide subunit release factor 1 (eRF1)
VTSQIVKRPLEPKLESAIAPLLEHLTRLPPGPHWIVSCYVRLEPGDRVRSRYLLALKERIKALEADPRVLTLSQEDRLAVERDLARIRGYLEPLRGLPHARGLAVFACEELGIFEAVPLPRVHRTRVMVDDTPWIAELVAASREAEPIIVTVMDRALARFFTVSPAGAVEFPGGFTVSGRGGRYRPDREDAPGRGERDYHGRLAEERHRHYALIAERLEELGRGRPASGVVLAGPADHTAALLRFLPDRLAARVLGSVGLNPTSATSAVVHAAAQRVAEDHERSAAAAAVLALQESIGTGWAVEGARETLRALSRGQVRTLYVRESLEGGGFRCGATGRLVLAKGDCRGEGEPRPVQDLVDEAIEDALRQRARVVIVPRDAGAEPVDGLAAILRFT